jgi:hypothetical protein
LEFSKSDKVCDFTSFTFQWYRNKNKFFLRKKRCHGNGVRKEKVLLYYTMSGGNQTYGEK